MITASPVVVDTILGSCVALTLYHPATRTGAICHGVQPGHDHPASKIVTHGSQDPCFRFVNCAIRHMLEHFDRRGIPRRELATKLFGGADMYPTHDPARTIGRQNIHMAEDEVRTAGLFLSATHVGGHQGRQILFFTHTGQVLMRRLGNPHFHASRRPLKPVV
ncbi:MAG: chemotaxis protein CheD [Magnetococcales bacterium]|nr:chemotaxis protein CheD [Magnetococcales bacterium]MBF0321697.1 chemotaxis protein CheD [Magnetococcales bacterium]